MGKWESLENYRQEAIQWKVYGRALIYTNTNIHIHIYIHIIRTCFYCGKMKTITEQNSQVSLSSSQTCCLPLAYYLPILSLPSQHRHYHASAWSTALCSDKCKWRRGSAVGTVELCTEEETTDVWKVLSVCRSEDMIFPTIIKVQDIWLRIKTQLKRKCVPGRSE